MQHAQHPSNGGACDSRASSMAEGVEGALAAARSLVEGGEWKAGLQQCKTVLKADRSNYDALT